MMNIESMSTQEQVYLYWEYCAATEDDTITFTEWYEMVTES